MKIFFFGDSITARGDTEPHGFIKNIRKEVKNKSDETVSIISKGIPANKVTNLEKRLQKDVISEKPDRVIILIGINDVWHTVCGGQVSLPLFSSTYNKIIDTLKENGIEVFVCTPTVIGEAQQGENICDTLLKEYTDEIRFIAHQHQIHLIDIHQAFLDYYSIHGYISKNSTVHSRTALYYGKLTHDGVHLNSFGNKVLSNNLINCCCPH
jgi:lysophospholipase L1-like esterase